MSRLWDHLEMQLGQPDEIEVEEHLDRCRRCCGEVAFVQELRAILNGPLEPDVPGEARRRLSELIDRLSV